MIVSKTENFIKRYEKLPAALQKKVDKQIAFLIQDFYYPSLHTKKLGNGNDWWEFRIDYHYRISGKKIDDTIVLHAVGPHDTGLGKK